MRKFRITPTKTLILFILFMSLLLSVTHHLFHPLTPSALWLHFSPYHARRNSSRVCPDPTHPDYFQNLASSVGVSASGLDIGEFSFFEADVLGMPTHAPATRRGIMALRNFEPGDTLMSMPLDSAFSVEQMHRSKINHLVPVFRELGMNDMSILIVTLMYEYSNPPSAWDSYLCTIPSSFSTTLYWPESQLRAAVVAAPRLQEYTDFRKQQFASNYLKHIPYLTQRFPQFFPASFFNFQNYVWAATACNSRSWNVAETHTAGGSVGRPTFIMAPVLDLLNHHTSSSTSNHALYDAIGRKFSIIAGPAGIKQGSEALLSYGRKCNAKLLADYGFAVARTGTDALPECD